MKAKTKANLAMGAFLGACLVPSLGMLVLRSEPAAANQTLAPPPSLTAKDGGLNPEVLSEAADYIEDHFALRQRLITANAALEGAVFHTSAQDSVLMGKQGWLFYRETVDDYLHTTPLPDRALYGAARTLALLTEYAEAHGARLAFTVAPNKASLYPEYLPYVGTPLAGQDDIDRLVPLLEEQGVAYIDLFAPFRAQDQVLYHATDSHWNLRGAALAHDTLVDGLGLTDSADWFTQPGQETGTHLGDLYEMVYPTGGKTEPETEFDQAFGFSAVRPIRSPEDMRIQTENAAKTGSLLMFRDSFGNTLYPFMADSFGQATFSRAMPYQMSLLEQTGADTVVLELVERNLDYLCTRAPVFPAPVRGLPVWPYGTVPDPLWEPADEPPQGEAAAAVTVRDNETLESSLRLEGYTRLEGTLTGPVDADSPIYVRTGDITFEACPVGEAGEGEFPFTLYVPEDSAETAQVLYLLDGQTRAVQAELHRD